MGRENTGQGTQRAMVSLVPAPSEDNTPWKITGFSFEFRLRLTTLDFCGSAVSGQEIRFTKLPAESSRQRSF